MSWRHKCQCQCQCQWQRQRQRQRQRQFDPFGWQLGSPELIVHVPWGAAPLLRHHRLQHQTRPLRRCFLMAQVTPARQGNQI